MHLGGFTRDSAALLVAALEVDIWEASLLRSKTHIGKVLSTYSLDNGPLNEKVDGNLTFRFSTFDWERTIYQLLIHNKIQYTILGTATMPSLRELMKKRVFVAEDDPDTLLVLKTALGDAGYHVRVSTLGMPVIEGNFSWMDVFILDRKMPDVDGLEVCRFLRQQQETRHTPVILISAIPDSDKAAFAAGADAYLAKPFQMHYLLNLVARSIKYKCIP